MLHRIPMGKSMVEVLEALRSLPVVRYFIQDYPPGLAEM